MNVILQEKTRNLGGIGEIVSVKPGYARNYLIPKGKAKRATKENIEQIEKQREQLELKEKEMLNKAFLRKEAIEKLGGVTIYAKAGEEGKLFGSVSTRDIATTITKAGVEVVKSEISLPQGAIRQIGEYDINLLLHTDVNSSIKVKVVPVVNE